MVCNRSSAQLGGRSPTLHTVVGFELMPPSHRADFFCAGRRVFALPLVDSDAHIATQLRGRRLRQSKRAFPKIIDDHSFY